MIKLFAHRGFVVENAQQNSIESLKEAVKENFKAIEFDIWFLNGNLVLKKDIEFDVCFLNGKLVLKHDQPKIDELDNLPVLQNYFCFGNSLEYWMDFKNLDENNAFEALTLTKDEIIAAKIDLNQIYFAPFITDYKKAAKVFAEIRRVFGDESNLVAVCKNIEKDEDVKNLQEFLAKNNIKFLSIFHKLLDENFVKNFNGIEFFAWTVNDLSRLLELEQLGIKNFATDKITPKIYEKNL